MVHHNTNWDHELFEIFERELVQACGDEVLDLKKYGIFPEKKKYLETLRYSNKTI